MKPSAGLWDAVVVGAGVAGVCTAFLLARRGWRVLLIEKSPWPRVTVCGGCLSALAVRTLDQIGMGSALADATRTRSVRWTLGNRSFEHLIPQGAVIERVKLDSALVELAVKAGAEFIPASGAVLMPVPSDSMAPRVVKLQCDSQVYEILAKLVIACDGIGGTLLNNEPWASWTVLPTARIGVCATYLAGESPVPLGQIDMCSGKHGYVGIARVDETTEHLAAALDPVKCRAQGGPVALVTQILESCRHTVPAALTATRFFGTGKLTRHREQLGGFRTLTAGDACGYVEPVTGEGMAWAILGAIELSRLLPASLVRWPMELPLQWKAIHSRAIGRRQRWCRAMRTTIHQPVMTAAGIMMGRAFPGVARRIAQVVCEKQEARNVK